MTEERKAEVLKQYMAKNFPAEIYSAEQRLKAAEIISESRWFEAMCADIALEEATDAMAKVLHIPEIKVWIEKKIEWLKSAF